MDSNFSTIEQILNEVQTIDSSFRRVADATGEHFNIFTLLQMETEEVRTHSRFIGELLNINGSHGQKSIFLELFIHHFLPDCKLSPENSKVFLEYHIGEVTKESGGRIDVLIKDNDNNVVMIENKIYALEQPNQLLRYHKKFPNGKLLYLTLNGDDSMNKNSFDKYTCLSYRTDMINWLEACKKESVNKPVLRETIHQYINLLKKLTNQNLNKQMNTEIMNRILRDKNSLIAYKSLLNVDKDLKKKMVGDLAGIIKEDIVEKYNFECIGKFPDCDIKGKGMLISFSNEELKKQGLIIRLNFEGNNHTNLIIGLKYVSDSGVEKFVLNKIEENSKFSTSQQYPAYMKLVEPFRDWYYLNLADFYFNPDLLLTEIKEKIEILITLIKKQ